jgi:uncharacterized coiled-coil protein SlyX
MAKFAKLASQETEVEELRKALQNAQRAHARAKRKTEDLVEAVYNATKDAILASNRPTITQPPKNKKGRAEVALLHLTDWQGGKRNTSYSLRVLSQRIDQVLAKTLQLTDIQRAHHPVNDCALVLGGDMVEGLTVFPGQAYEVEAHLFEQLFEVARIIEGAVLSLAGYFNTVHVVCEYGNHGRIGRKGDMPVADNIDRMAYKIAADRLAHVKHVNWQMSPDWHQMLKLGNYRALIVHGDEVPSFGGQTPSYSILRKCNAWASGVVDDFTDVYMGHFHTPMTLTMANGGRVFVTGSPESGNEYARAFVAAVGRPSQRLHYVDPDKGRVTGEYVLWLD